MPRLISWPSHFSRYAAVGRERPARLFLLPVPFLFWDELVLCGTRLHQTARVEVRGSRPLWAMHKYYTLGVWSENNSISPREVSVARLMDRSRRIHWFQNVLAPISAPHHPRNPEGNAASNSLSGLSPEPHAGPSPQEPKRGAWGKIISVPERSQVPYGEKQGWCSPTSTSMVLAYWAKALGRPELDLSVPEVAKGVYDKNWPGTGNWPFNTAFAGKVSGLRSYVMRLNYLADLEEYILAGVPIVLSVSYVCLRQS